MKKLTSLNQILFFVLLLVLLMFFGAGFLIPLMFGVMLATLMSPFTDFQERHRIPRALAAGISTLLVFIVVGGLFYMLVHQIDIFISDIDDFRNNFKSLISRLQKQIRTATDLSLEQQNQIWQQRSEEMMGMLEQQLTLFFATILHTLLSFLLVLVYVFLLLLYRKKIISVVMMYSPAENRHQSDQMLTKSGKVVYHYLWGRAKVMMLLGIMYYITFISFGLPYAVLLTLFGTLVTIVPYLGPLVSGVLPVFVAATEFDSTQRVLLLTATIIVIQLIESYLIEPLIIGKEVRLNPLMIIIAIITGSMIWGVAGMILFVPLFAMFKILCDHTPSLKPIGFLFGNKIKVDQE
jgi:predicted PurR-regulated permease PerM